MWVSESDNTILAIDRFEKSPQRCTWSSFIVRFNKTVNVYRNTLSSSQLSKGIWPSRNTQTVDNAIYNLLIKNALFTVVVSICVRQKTIINLILILKNYWTIAQCPRDVMWSLLLQEPGTCPVSLPITKLLQCFWLDVARHCFKLARFAQSHPKKKKCDDLFSLANSRNRPQSCLQTEYAPYLRTE